MNDRPSLSVLLATPDNFSTLRRTVEALQRQTIADEMELIFIIPDPQAFEPDPAELVGFHSYQVLEHPVAGCLADARAAGVHAARSPYVAVGEDHSFPHRQWAERIIVAHQRGYRAVGAAMANPRPRSSIGWGDMITNFLPYIHPATGGLSPMLPGHNTSYDREILLQLGGRLVDLLQVESVLHLELAAKGEPLWLESKALTTHHNLLEPTRFIYHKWLGGLLFGSLRSRDWPFRRRLIHGLMSPLIPPLRLWRMRQGLSRLHQRNHCVIRALPWIVLALICHGAGEGIGTLMGHGSALRHYWKLEFHRIPVKPKPTA